jgi:hypothetical protein
MTSHGLTIYDPAMCCSTGVCGPEVDPALVRFAADLEALSARGVPIRRHNLAQEPGAFIRERAVRQALQEEGEGALPLVLQEGRVLSRSRYPSRQELEAWTGLDRETLER